MNGQLAFGYPWWLSYGHLVVAGLTFCLFLLGYRRRWPRLPVLLFAILALWSAAGFVVARFVIDFNGRASLPTESFLRSGAGRVLDLGAGTGRSSIMVLEARPAVTLVALDLFETSWTHHFGPAVDPKQQLLANLRTAGVAERASITAADMRALPFGPAEFDAIVSSYAIDHLNREGVDRSLAEAARVLKPGGEFLLMVVGKDPYMQFAFGPLLMHSSTRGSAWWTSRLQEAGFQVFEDGMRPATLYLLARRPA